MSRRRSHSRSHRRSRSRGHEVERRRYPERGRSRSPRTTDRSTATVPALYAPDRSPPRAQQPPPRSAPFPPARDRDRSREHHRPVTDQKDERPVTDQKDERRQRAAEVVERMNRRELNDLEERRRRAAKVRSEPLRSPYMLPLPADGTYPSGRFSIWRGAPVQDIIDVCASPSCDSPWVRDPRTKKQPHGAFVVSAPGRSGLHRLCAHCRRKCGLEY